MDCFDLSGKVALVTGSSKGIGFSIASHLARAGARVVISSRKEQPCQEAADAIRAAGGEAVAIPGNVGRDEDRQRMIAETREQLGPIDVLICNAAANPYYGPMAEITDEAYHKTMDTNVLGALRLGGLVREEMAARGGGSMIVVASIAALRGVGNLGAYGVSKAAVVHLVRQLAVEWGRDNVRVNAILPGLVKTDFARKLWEDPAAEERVLRSYPLARLGEPDDIGPAAVFLASRAGAWITGHALVIDGGTTIKE